MLQEVCGSVFFDAELPPGASLSDELPRLGWAFVRLVTDRHRLATYRLAMAEAERTPEVSRLFYEGAVMMVVGRIAARLREHVATLDENRARELAGIFLCLVEGHAFLRLMMGLDAKVDEPAFARQIALATQVVCERVGANA